MKEYIIRFLQSFSREEVCLLNKAELARRFNCDPRTIDRYIRISTGELVPKERTHSYKSKLDDYKELIINKVDNYGCTAMSVFKLIQKNSFTKQKEIQRF